jgi:hypothetical protein
MINNDELNKPMVEQAAISLLPFNFSTFYIGSDENRKACLEDTL